MTGSKSYLYRLDIIKAGDTYMGFVVLEKNYRYLYA